MAGIETRMRDVFILRFGFRHDESATAAWPARVRLGRPEIEDRLRVEKATEGASGALHSVDMRIPF